MLNVIIIIAPLFFIIFVSAIIQHFKKLNKHWWNYLNSFALNIWFPALIFSALSKTTFSFDGHSDIIYGNSLFLISGFAIAYFLWKIIKLSRKSLKTFYICFIFWNVAYLGIPIITQIYWDSTVWVTSLIAAIYLFWVFTIWIWFLEYLQIKKWENLIKKIIINLIKNPLLISVFVGFVVSIFNIHIHAIILESITMIANCVTPIVLIVIWLFIWRTKIWNLSHWFPVLAFSLTTLLIVPWLYYFWIKWFWLTINNYTASIIDAAMPLAITPFALADKYDLNKRFIANCIVLSTVLSIITIPFWIWILSNMI